MSFEIIAAFVFGTIIGSFLNVVIWRLPREEKLNGRSHCPHCDHQLSWIDLIPIVSIVLQGGKCRYCKKPISLRYPFIETLTGFLFAGAMAMLVPVELVDWLLLVKAAIAIAICIAVFVIDLEHYLILDKIVFPALIAMGVILVAESIIKNSPGPLVAGILSAGVPFIIFWFIWFVSKGKWMGYGDVKFVALMGLMLDWPGILVAIFLAFVVGALFGIVLILIGKKQLSSKLPFGTFLSLSSVVSLFFASQIWDWYWNLFRF